MKNEPLKRSLTFMVLTLLVASPFYIAVIRAGSLGTGFGLILTGWLWSPTLAAILTCKLYGQPLPTDSWRWPPRFHAVLAYLLAPGYVLLAYLPVWLLGLGRFYDAAFAKRVAASLAWTGMSTPVVLGFFVILQATLGVVREGTAALGEEIGWRGFLVPELAKTMTFTQTSLISAVATVLWALPVIPATTHKMASPLWYRLTCFTALVFGISFAFTWLRLRTGSLWPGLILHASHNLFVDRVFTPLTADTGRTVYYVDEFGAALAIALVLVGSAFWAQRHRLDAMDESFLRVAR